MLTRSKNNGGIRSVRFPILARFALVGAVALSLLVPLAMIRDKISERRDRAAAVQKAFAEETSGPQALAGPFLALSCEETYIDERVVHLKNGKPLTVREKKQRPCATGLFLPKRLSVDGSAPVEGRHRGIYPIRLYRAQLELSGAFDVPPTPAESGDTVRAWKEAYLVLAISDVRGIKDAPGAWIGAGNREFMPGTLDTRIKSGLHASLGSYAELQREPDIAFRVPVEVIGTSRLEIAPIGHYNDVRVVSGWPHPSFVGAYSPDARDISRAGFSARWRVSHFATGGNAFWLEAAAGDKLFSNPRLLGISFVEPVNPYSMSYRATEYGFLFVLLTFSAFALVEVVWRVRLHTVQYALAGLALAVFFLLLIALSEHIYFGFAYAAAAVGCVALLTHYLRHPLGSAGRTVVFAGLFAALYAALYVLLSSEDHSLLLGSLLVFGTLATAMILTRRLDWANAFKPAAPAAP